MPRWLHNLNPYWHHMKATVSPQSPYPCHTGEVCIFVLFGWFLCWPSVLAKFLWLGQKTQYLQVKEEIYFGSQFMAVQVIVIQVHGRAAWPRDSPKENSPWCGGQEVWILSSPLPFYSLQAASPLVPPAPSVGFL